jgi:hypothetical protein
MRVAFLPSTVAGHPLVLSQSIAEMGLEVRLWQLEENLFGYGDQKPIFNTTDRFTRRELKRLLALVQVLRWSDVIHCTFGSTLSGNSNYSEKHEESAVLKFKEYALREYENLFLRIELLLYKVYKKKLIMDYQGDDIRQKEFQLENYKHSIAHEVDSSYYSIDKDSLKRKKLKLYSKSGFVINALNPDLLNYLPKGANFLPYSNVDLDGLVVRKVKAMKKPYLFVHAPSNRKVKGTNLIISTIEELQQEGFAVELKLIEGMTNRQAMQEYGKAFMAIDQINAGWYGGFAVECMAQGVPVISYLRESDLIWIPKEMQENLPVLNACACTLKDVIVNSIKFSQSEYEELSLKSFKYVHRWHDPNQIARQVINSYSG